MARHILLWCAAGRTPTEMAAVLFCSRSSVDRTVRAYRARSLGLECDDQGRLRSPIRPTGLVPTLCRSLVARLKASPRAYGWCRTPWSGATLALTRPAQWGAHRLGRAEAPLGACGWLGVEAGATLVAKDDDPRRVHRRARSRLVCEQLKQREGLVCADAWAIHLWPKVGWAGMPQETPLEVMTPGQNQKAYVAGALDLTTGSRLHGVGPRTTHALCRDLLGHLEASDPATRYPRVSVVVDLSKIHQAKAVEPWLAAHPRLTWLWWPTDGPRANPIERAFGDVHDGCTRNHRRTRLPALVADVKEQMHRNGPWKYRLSDLYDEPAITAAVANIAAEEHAKAVA